MTTFQDISGVRVITLVDNRLDAARAPGFKQLLIKNVTDRPDRVMIDASKVDFIDSTGLGVLVLLLKMMGDSGRIVVAGAKPSVRRLFEITKLDNVFALTDDVEAALLILRG